MSAGTNCGVHVSEPGSNVQSVQAFIEQNRDVLSWRFSLWGKVALGIFL
jgi:hypothetical protein